MASVRFTKMHGCGNDFLIFEPEEVEGADLSGLARRACERRFGVGADGILIPAGSDAADVKMIYYNSDGSVAEMCGNGIRCLARYLGDRGRVQSAFTVETGAGLKKILLREDGSSRVDLGVPAVRGRIALYGYAFLRVSTGNPHAVTFLGDERVVEELDLEEIGPAVERHPAFPEGTNVEFAYVRGAHEIRMRIWERGAGATLASGTGSGATAVAAIHRRLAESPVRVVLDGGTVEVEWAGEGEPVYMSGPAEYVCEGELLI